MFEWKTYRNWQLKLTRVKKILKNWWMNETVLKMNGKFLCLKTTNRCASLCTVRKRRRGRGGILMIFIILCLVVNDSVPFCMSLVSLFRLNCTSFWQIIAHLSGRSHYNFFPLRLIVSKIFFHLSYKCTQSILYNYLSKQLFSTQKKLSV